MSKCTQLHLILTWYCTCSQQVQCLASENTHEESHSHPRIHRSPECFAQKKGCLNSFVDVDWLKQLLVILLVFAWRLSLTVSKFRDNNTDTYCAADEASVCLRGSCSAVYKMHVVKVKEEQWAFCVREKPPSKRTYSIRHTSGIVSTFLISKKLYCHILVWCCIQVFTKRLHTER